MQSERAHAYLYWLPIHIWREFGDRIGREPLDENVDYFPS